MAAMMVVCSAGLKVDPKAYRLVVCSVGLSVVGSVVTTADRSAGSLVVVMVATKAVQKVVLLVDPSGDSMADPKEHSKADSTVATSEWSLVHLTADYSADSMAVS